PLSFIQRSAFVYPDKTAIVHGDKRYTYREFGERVNRLASALQKRGLRKGDRVAVLLPNIPPMLDAHFAVLLAGGMIVPINYRLAPKEVEYILNHSGATFLICDTEFSNLVSPVKDNIETVKHYIDVVDVEGFDRLGDTTYEEFLQEGSPEPFPWVIEDELEEITINYTSGTTGRPKGVVFTHRGAYLNAINETMETHMTPDTIYLWTLPMFHCNGWCFTWGVTALGGTHVCLRKFEPADVWPLIDKENVTHLNGAPVVLIALLNDPGRPKKLDRPLTITTAGAPPSPTLIENIQAMGATIIHVYGLTETYGPTTICAPQPDWKDRSLAEQGKLLARQGVAYIMSDPIRIVDDDMNDVPRDGKTLGEVVMTGNMVMKGYYNDPEATEEAFRGGYFHSGDVAVWHPDGYAELRDRSKDVIISGGENISSIEVEQVIYRHPAVLECAVIGVPHEKWGESPKAFITLKPGQTATQEEIVNFCRENIAHFKCPTTVDFIDLPKTSTGKIQKFILRDKEWEGKEKRIQG
ncbi:MAG: long-chain-fatty-acid--CoA ligase, partial [Candidatus Hydrogenedentes bacterium]|nr:long-chain-fatty-acid--CoA ligase [Candidatus Hydrogenedentota bacterium]